MTVNTEKTFFVSHSAVLVYTGIVINVSAVICPLKKLGHELRRPRSACGSSEVWGDRNGAGFMLLTSSKPRNNYKVQRLFSLFRG